MIKYKTITNGHIAHANTACFNAKGITKDTPDPPNGRYIKDKEGNLTGELQELPAIAQFFQIGEPLTLEDFQSAIAKWF